MGSQFETLCKGLSQFLNPSEAEQDAREVLHYFSDKHELSNPLKTIIPTLQTELEHLVEEVIRRRALGEPLAYVLGEKGFYKDVFIVSPDVLIPRADTESLVEVALQASSCRRKDGFPFKILDIGTGTGCIGLSLSKYLDNTDTTLLDIEESALSIARANAIKLGLVDFKIKFVLGSVFDFSKLFFQEKFNLIVSNPPYIKAGDPRLEESVFAFEPKRALFATQEGLEFYKFYAECAFDWLHPEGRLVCEIANDMELNITKMFSTLNWKELKFYKDISGHTRVFSIVKR